MGLRQFVFMTGTLAVSLTVPVSATADVLSDLADQCMTALQSGDDTAFQAAAEAIQQQENVFNTEARMRAEACLSQGFGEPWEYWSPARMFMPVAEAEARLKTMADENDQRIREEAERNAKIAMARLAEEQARAENAAQVAELVYRSCATLLARDEVAAMTNALCVESFLTNGLPSSTAP